MCPVCEIGGCVLAPVTTCLVVTASKFVAVAEVARECKASGLWFQLRPSLLLCRVYQRW